MAPSISSPTSSSSSRAPSIKSASGQPRGQKRANMKPRSGPVDKRKRLAANARERKRMDLLNKAFDLLRGRLNDARNKSKYDVLVQAKEYIQALARICADHDRDNPDHPSALANEASLKGLQHCDTELSAFGAKFDSRNEPRTGQQLDSRAASVAPIHWQQPIHSPGSSNDCCLSPMSLAESLGSSGSPRCSSQPQQSFQHNLSSVYPKQQLSDGNIAFLRQAHRPLIKEELMSEISHDYHQIYHPHYQSLLRAHRHAPIN